MTLLSFSRSALTSLLILDSLDFLIDAERVAESLFINTREVSSGTKACRVLEILVMMRLYIRLEGLEGSNGV